MREHEWYGWGLHYYGSGRNIADQTGGGVARLTSCPRERRGKCERKEGFRSAEVTLRLALNGEERTLEAVLQRDAGGQSLREYRGENCVVVHVQL